MANAGQTAVLAGGSGLVGGELLRLLETEPAYGRVCLLGRRTVPTTSGRVAQAVVDFASLDAKALAGATDVFCCLGTTIRKAGSQEAFRAVDFTAVLNVARAAGAAGARHFLVVSSIGADARSKNFYLRVKGEMEEAVSRLALPGVSIFRPSFLAGERAESRPGERLGIAAAGLIGLLPIDAIRKYRPIPAATVACAMARVAAQGPKGVQVHESARIHELGAGRGALS